MTLLKTKSIYCILFLLCGISFLHCIDCDCSYVKPFFQTKEMTLEHHQTNGGFSTPYTLDKPLDFQRYGSLRIQFDVDYLAQQCLQDYLPNLTQTALACDCAPSGWRGSKTERLEALHIISLHDFNVGIKKLDTLNTRFEISSQDFNNILLPENLDTYVQRDTALLLNNAFDLHLLEKPSASDTFQVRVIVELNDSVQYVAESRKLIFE